MSKVSVKQNNTSCELTMQAPKYYIVAAIIVMAIIILALGPPNTATANPANETFSKKLVKAAIERTKHFVIYDGSYKRLAYPMGDVSPRKGVCTDVVIRTYRKLGIDLQKDVHVHMRKNFSRYPKIWGLKKTDTNIDHRRVPNLQVFFRAKGTSLAVTKKASNYKPGDLVTWMLPGNLPHIGIVVNKKSADNKRYLIVHNIGLGPRMEDMLFHYKITGHYRYRGSK